MEILGWVIIGLICGWLAGEVMRNHGFALLVDIVVGIVGAILGGLLAVVAGWSMASPLASLLVSFVGAVIVLLCLTFLRGSEG